MVGYAQAQHSPQMLGAPPGPSSSGGGIAAGEIFVPLGAAPATQRQRVADNLPRLDQGLSDQLHKPLGPTDRSYEAEDTLGGSASIPPATASILIASPVNATPVGLPAAGLTKPQKPPQVQNRSYLTEQTTTTGVS